LINDERAATEGLSWAEGQLRPSRFLINDERAATEGFCQMCTW
jgi:hypothetical protein